MLYNLLVRMISRGQTEGLQNKLDIYFAAGRLSESEYTALTEQLGSRAE